MVPSIVAVSLFISSAALTSVGAATIQEVVQAAAAQVALEYDCAIMIGYCNRSVHIEAAGALPPQHYHSWTDICSQRDSLTAQAVNLHRLLTRLHGAASPRPSQVGRSIAGPRGGAV